MIYLSGGVRPDMARLHPGLGFMHTPGMYNARIPGAQAGADTGLYGNPKGWTLNAYLDWLRVANSVTPKLLFATAPDKVGDAAETLALSLPVLPTLRSIGVPPAYVAQDHFWDYDIPWELFDCLFIGGTDKFKLGPNAKLAMQAARHRGKWVHVGRVNSWRRIELMHQWGADSVDGTFINFGPYINAPQIVGWLARLEALEKMRAYRE